MLLWWLSLGLVLLCGSFLAWRKGLFRRQRQETDVGAKTILNDDNDARNRPKITILFATQTGTAENFAKILGEQARGRYGAQVSVDVIDVDEYGNDDAEIEVKLSKELFLLLLFATYGDGEPTDSAMRFTKWLSNKAEEAEQEERPLFPCLAFGVFALGNRQYEHFNAVGKQVDENLFRIGADRIVPVGLGDDDKCIEDDFASWRELLWPQLELRLQGALGKNLLESHAEGGSLSTSAYKFEILPPSVKTVTDDRQRNGTTVVDLHHPVRCPVAIKRELHSKASDRSCIHLEFDIGSSGIRYETGDHVGVFVENSGMAVYSAAECLGLPLGTVFSLHCDDADSARSSSLPPPFPTPTTLEVALLRYADLLSPPRKSALSVLAQHASDEAEAARLRHLASPEGKDEYATWVIADHRSLLEVMCAFPSARPPLGVFFAAVAPRLQPRYYSISSSPLVAPDRIHVTCAVVRGYTPGGRLHEGVASTWMERAVSVDSSVTLFQTAPVFVRTSGFKLPQDPITPIVMVGPGTGLAPFRGFLQERAAMVASGRDVGEALLFFGCRHSQKDFIYREEMDEFVRCGALSELHVAFSREGEEKEYVQHKMMAQADRVWSLLSAKSDGGGGGCFYVCGDAKAMAKDVHRALQHIIARKECVTATKAEEIVKEMQAQGRYHRDVW